MAISKSPLHPTGTEDRPSILDCKTNAKQGCNELNPIIIDERALGDEERLQLSLDRATGTPVSSHSINWQTFLRNTLALVWVLNSTLNATPTMSAT
jgi:hypothetical protein